MEQMKIGSSQVTAPRLTLGTYGMGGGSSWQDTTTDDQELVDFIRAAHDQLGIWGIDTAPVYGTGRSERIVGQAVRGNRENYYISTKCGLHWRDENGRFEYTRDGKAVYLNFSKESLIQDCEDSLRRLNTDYIDLLIIHRCPQDAEIPEAMEAMEILKSRGLIRAVGLSNAALGPHLEETVEICRKYGQLDLLQEGASLLKRTAMERFIRICEANHMTYQPYSALEKGALAGKLIEHVDTWSGDNRSKYPWFQPDGIKKLNALTLALGPIADQHHCSIPALCLAWVLAQSDCVNLLVGARRMESITDAMKALDVTLSAQDIAEMNRLADVATA